MEGYLSLCLILRSGRRPRLERWNVGPLFETRDYIALLTMRAALGGLSYRAEANERVIGAPVALAADIGRGETQVDEVASVGRKRGIVERLQQRTRDHVRLLVPALA